MKYDPNLIEQIPQEIRLAASHLADLCRVHDMPSNMIYDGVAWDVEGLIKIRVMDLLFK